MKSFAVVALYMNGYHELGAENRSIGNKPVLRIEKAFGKQGLARVNTGLRISCLNRIGLIYLFYLPFSRLRTLLMNWEFRSFIRDGAK
jgi:hypothetical protein